MGNPNDAVVEGERRDTTAGSPATIGCLQVNTVHSQRQHLLHGQFLCVFDEGIVHWLSRCRTGHKVPSPNGRTNQTGSPFDPGITSRQP